MLSDDERRKSISEAVTAAQKQKRIRAECREKCEGLCYRCIEESYLCLIDALNDNVSFQLGISHPLALKIAALVYRGVYHQLVIESGCPSTESEAHVFAEVQELLEAN